MVTIVKSLVGTDVDYAQAQVRSRHNNELRLQIATSDSGFMEFDFAVPEDVFQKVYARLAEAVEAAKPVVKKAPLVVIPLTLEARVANLEGFLSTIIIAN